MGASIMSVYEFIFVEILVIEVEASPHRLIMKRGTRRGLEPSLLQPLHQIQHLPLPSLHLAAGIDL
jgi:hypothetical protein